MISVVIPTYQRAELCIRAIQSVLQQTVTDIEIIVVDDASKDGSFEKIKAKSSDPRIKFYGLAVNSGGGAARNFGVQQAQGDLIAFLDSDDWWANDKLMQQVQYISERVSGENWITCNSVVISLGPPNLTKPNRTPSESEDLSSFLLVEQNYLQTSGLLMPRSTALQYPFDENLRRHQDIDLLLRLRKDGVTFHYCTAETVFYGCEDVHHRVGQMSSVEPTIYLLNAKQHLLSTAAKAELLFLIAKCLLKQKKLSFFWYLCQSIFINPLILRSVTKDSRKWFNPRG